MAKPDTTQISITLGGWAEFCIRGDRLSCRQMERGGIETIAEINLGRVTKKRIENLQSYLERLKVHAVE